MSCHHHTRWFLAVTASIVLAPAFAVEPIPITADQAFDARMAQTDPLSGDPAAVALVDVRSNAEYYWVGTAAMVKEIWLKGRRGQQVINPDSGKVKLVLGGRLLEYTVNKRPQWTWVNNVVKLETDIIAENIPYKLWDEYEGVLQTVNPGFAQGIDDVYKYLSTNYPGKPTVLIVFCRSGGRSTGCGVNISSGFTSVYEIDDPSSKATLVGGFEGPGYQQTYNGYLGFPGRPTQTQDTPSVSWKDAGLPIKIGGPVTKIDVNGLPVQ